MEGKEVDQLREALWDLFAQQGPLFGDPISFWLKSTSIKWDQKLITTAATIPLAMLGISVLSSLLVSTFRSGVFG